MVWRLPLRSAALSSAAVGGGWSSPGWILNVQVERNYSRTDIDAHIAEVAQAVRLTGEGIGLLTSANIALFGSATDAGIHVEATAGVSHPTWAASDNAEGDSAPESGFRSPGTINIVARLPVPLATSAAVNAIITITEAKTQALLSRGVNGSGTPSDAATVVWPTTGDHHDVAFCGPRSVWGAALARATFAAVGSSLDRRARAG